jgi:hypothetical protein
VAGLYSSRYSLVSVFSFSSLLWLPYNQHGITETRFHPGWKSRLGTASSPISSMISCRVSSLMPFSNAKRCRSPVQLFTSWVFIGLANAFGFCPSLLVFLRTSSRMYHGRMAKADVGDGSLSPNHSQFVRIQ